LSILPIRVRPRISVGLGRADLLQMLQTIAVSMLKCVAQGEVARQSSCPIERIEVAGGVGIFMGAGSPLTRSLGMGTCGDVAEVEVEEVENFFQSRGASVRIAVSDRTPSSLTSILERRGYSRSLPMSNWYLQLGNRPPEVKSDVTIESAEIERADLWAQTVGIGFQEADKPETAIDASVADLFKILGFASHSRSYFALPME